LVPLAWRGQNSFDFVISCAISFQQNLKGGHVDLKTTGKHLLADFFECGCEFLDKEDKIRETMILAAERTGATVVGSLFHKFSPQGVSGVVVISESHLSIHTWPEERYAAVDVYTCGDCAPEKAISFLTDVFCSLNPKTKTVIRGTK
jgi:S-adenosylmethionine decarboxylase